MKTNVSKVWRVLTALTLAVAAGKGLGAVADIPETWSSADAAGWVNHDLVNEKLQNAPTVENGALKLVLKAQQYKAPPEECVLEAGSEASAGSFTGDYVTLGITEIRFRLFCQRQAEVSLLLWNNESSRVWRHRIPDIRTGEWMSVSVPIAIPALRCLNGAKQLGLFEADLRHVTAIGVAIEREQSLAAQSYWLDDFTLVGRNARYAAWMEGFVKPPGYGTGDCSVLPDADLDGDGMCNFGEWTAGTSAGDAADHFRVAIERGDSRSRLRWKASPGRTYQVWSTTDLDTPFTPMGPALDATVPENVFNDTSTNGTIQKFYKLTVECPEP